jgi:hypothetical protein
MCHGLVRPGVVQWSRQVKLTVKEDKNGAAETVSANFVMSENLFSASDDAL